MTPPAPKARLSDNALLDVVQRETLRYFWDYGHPISGMARERWGADMGYDNLATVTTGGTGFGVMAMIAGAERGFLPKAEVIARIDRITRFLDAAPRYRGAFAHWMNGETGETFAFSENDIGGDIVETAFLMMGLLTARQYLGMDHPTARRIDALWRGVDWAGFCDGPARLMWHYSPKVEWGPALPIRGWHEGLMAYVLGAASPTHPIDPVAYHQGWKDSPTYLNGRSNYRIRLPMGPELGGPMFFAHYSFLGLDPRGLHEGGVDFWAQNRAHARTQAAYCRANPAGHAGYGPAWGLTACDGPDGYDAFSPTNDRGVIAPTAALASMPYTPTASLRALRHYQQDFDGALWGPYGLRDSFCPARGWVAPSHIAIDQGPIVCMIENHRSALLWRLFMSAPEVGTALQRLGFTRQAVA